MAFIFNEKKKLYVSKTEKQSLLFAVSDLVKDIDAVCCGAQLVDDARNADIVICSTDNEEFATLSKGVTLERDEEFYYSVEDGKIRIFGKGDLGTMWGIYTFSERELGIPPYYLFDDFALNKKSNLTIENKSVNEYPKTKFRGWFINDEDLLDGFMHLGERNLDYVFYKNVIHPDLMSMIVETALRFKMNLLIPSTLINICNPPEENLVKLISERGLYISQHHIEPLGVFRHGMDKFLKDNGYDTTISYVTNKQGLIACWKYYAEKWAKYPRVIWQLGLRGMSDKPVWEQDSAVGKSDEARGSLIADAIQTQFDIVSSVAKGEIYTSSTVWMEGADLLKKKVLSLPQNTITVFADIGMSQAFGNDFFSIEREQDRKYGIYYHAAYWHVGPHLAEGVIPQKMQYFYNLAREHDSLYYSMLNVGNLKEFTFTVNINSKLCWYGERADLGEIIREYCENYVGKESASQMILAIDQYYRGLGEVQEEEYEKFCKRYNFDCKLYNDVKFPLVNLNDGIMYWCLHNEFNFKKEFYTKEFADTVKMGCEYMQQASATFEAIADSLPRSQRGALEKQWCYQSFLWKYLLLSAKEFCLLIEAEDATKEDFVKTHQKSIEYIDKIIEKRKECYTGKWLNYFNGDRKVSIKNLRNIFTREIKDVDNYF